MNQRVYLTQELKEWSDLDLAPKSLQERALGVGGFSFGKFKFKGLRFRGIGLKPPQSLSLPCSDRRLPPGKIRCLALHWVVLGLLGWVVLGLLGV